MQQVHLIPNDDDAIIPSQVAVPPAIISPTLIDAHPENICIADAIETFKNAALNTREIGAAVIKREAVKVNHRLMDQFRRGSKRTTSIDDEGCDDDHRPTKRSRNDIGATFEIQSEGACPPSPVTEEDDTARSILDRAVRTKRMSVLLRNLEMTQIMLHREMVACLSESNNDEVESRYR